MALLGYLLYAEAINPWTTVGGIVIFAANYGVREEAAAAMRPKDIERALTHGILRQIDDQERRSPL